MNLKYFFVIILFPFYIQAGEIIEFSPYDVKLKKNADIIAELHVPEGPGPFPLFQKSAVEIPLLCGTSNR